MSNSNERPRDFALGALTTIVATAIAVFLTFIALAKGLEKLAVWAFSHAWSPW